MVGQFSLKSLARFSEHLRMVEAVRAGGRSAHTARSWGPALVFGRLWERQGVPGLLKAPPADRKFGFDVERTFREEKSTLQVRPTYHHNDDPSMGHIVASFLALRLEVGLERRLDERGVAVSWMDLMRDLGQVQAVEVELDGERYRLRTDLMGKAEQAFAAAGLRPPASVTPLGPAA